MCNNENAVQPSNKVYLIGGLVGGFGVGVMFSALLHYFFNKEKGI